MTKPQLLCWVVLGLVIGLVALGSCAKPIPLLREELNQGEMFGALGMAPGSMRMGLHDYAVLQVSLSLLFLAVIGISTQSVLALSIRRGSRLAASTSWCVGLAGMLAVFPTVFSDAGGLLIRPDSAPALRVPVGVLVTEALLVLCFLAVTGQQTRSELSKDPRSRVRSWLVELGLVAVAVAVFAASKYVVETWAGFTLGGFAVVLLPERLGFFVFPVVATMVSFVIGFGLSNVLAFGIRQGVGLTPGPPVVLPVIGLLLVGAVGIGDWRAVLPSGLASALSLGGQSVAWRMAVSAVMGVAAGLAASVIARNGRALQGSPRRMRMFLAPLAAAPSSTFVVTFGAVFTLGYVLPSFLAGGGGNPDTMKLQVVRGPEPEAVSVLGITETQLLRIGRVLGPGCVFCGWAVNAEAPATAELRYSCQGGQRVLVLRKESGRLVGHAELRAGKEVRGLGGCSVFEESWIEQLRTDLIQAFNAFPTVAKGERPTFDVFCGNAKHGFVLAVEWWGRACRPQTELLVFSRTRGWWEVPIPAGTGLHWCRPEENVVRIVSRGGCASQGSSFFSGDFSLFSIRSAEPPRPIACLPRKALEAAGIDDYSVNIADVSDDGRSWLFRYSGTVRRWRYVLFHLESGRATPLPFRAAVAFFLPKELVALEAAQDGYVELRLR